MHVHTLPPLVLSPPSLPALTRTIQNLQVSACLKKGREKNRVKTYACEENEQTQLMVESWTWDQKVMGFKSWQEWWENFLLQGQLSVLTSYFSIRFIPVLLQ